MKLSRGGLDRLDVGRRHKTGAKPLLETSRSCHPIEPLIETRDGTNFCLPNSNVTLDELDKIQGDLYGYFEWHPKYRNRTTFLEGGSSFLHAICIKSLDKTNLPATQGARCEPMRKVDCVRSLSICVRLEPTYSR